MRAPGRAPTSVPPAPRPPRPRSRLRLLFPPQPRRDHVGGHRERPHRGPGGDPGVQLQQGQQAPGSHHAVPHRGRGRPFGGGDAGEPGAAARTPSWAVSRMWRSPSPSPPVSPPTPDLSSLCSHRESPDPASLPPPHPRFPAPRAHICASILSPRGLPRSCLETTRSPFLLDAFPLSATARDKRSLLPADWEQRP